MKLLKPDLLRKHEGIWTKEIEDDIYRYLSEKQWQKLKESFESILDDPMRKTERITGWKDNIRKIRMNNFRLILFIREDSVYALMLKHRKDVYSRQNKQKIEKMTDMLLRLKNK